MSLQAFLTSLGTGLGTAAGNVGSSLVNNAGSVALGGAGLLLGKEAYDRLGDIGDQALVGSQIEGPDGTMINVPGALDIAQLGIDQSTFQPYGVTSATGGQFSYDPTTGQASLAGSPQEQAIQNMLLGQAQSTFGATPYGQAGGRAAAEQAYGLGGQFMTASQTQPADINALRGMFANQAASALGGGGGQGQLGQLPQNYTPSQSGPRIPAGFLGTVSTGNSTYFRNPQTGESFTISGQMSGNPTMSEIQPAPEGFEPPPDLQTMRQKAGLSGQLQAPSIGQLGQQALGLGSQGLATQAPSDVEALRSQYGQLAGQAAGSVLGSTAGRESDVYNRIRATQRPEEERQRMALEERLFNQGRSGVSTNMYGGTPEQLALAKAQEESQNQASLAAIQQAQTEQQQALGIAETFGGMFGQQAGLSSDVQTQAQARAAQLSELGLSANQIESQLQTEGLGRAVASSGQSAALAKLAGDLQAQQAGLGLGMSELGSMLSAQDMALLGAQQDLGMGALAGSYVPQAQLLAAMQGSELYPQLQQRGQLYGSGLFGEASMGGLEAFLGAGLGQANLMGQLGTGLLSGAVR